MHPLIPWFETVKIPIAGDFAIHGFGILVALGFIFGAQRAMKKATRDGLDPDLINRAVTWIVVAVFVGGHLGHLLFYYPQDLIDDPMVIFKVWSGLSSFGGFLASGILVTWFIRKQDKLRILENRRRNEAGEELLPRLRVLPYADALAYGLSLGWFFGRMGCFVAHDHPGTQTNFFLGVYGMCPPAGRDLGVACHDLGLYEALWALSMAILFTVLDKKPRFPGFYLTLLMMAYGPFRLVLDFYRHPSTDTRYLGLTPAQYGSVLLVIVGAWMWKHYRDAKPVRPVAATGKAAD